MYFRCTISYIPFRILSFLFLIWSNSSYAPIGKNAGFYCDDESIKHPYHGDSVHVSYLFIVLLGIFSLCIYVSEVILEANYINSSEPVKSKFQLHLKHYLSGFLFVLAVTEVLKFYISELRPHFFYTCLPNMNSIKCSDGLITYFNCTGKGPRWLVENDIYKSFPSGHAALSVYAFTFISIYLHTKAKYISWKSGVWWIRSVTALSLIWAVVCCISRIMDNRHFWWDVVSGALIGAVGGLLTALVSLRTDSEKVRS